MTESTDARVVRQACRELTNTAASLKSAWRKFQENHPDADEAEVANIRGEMYKLIKKSRAVRAAAVEADIDVQKLDEALNTAERRGKECREQSPQRDCPLPPGTPPRYETISIASTNTEGRRDLEKERREGARPKMNKRMDNRHELESIMTSRSGDERELDLEERRIRLETDQQILDARRNELERLMELEERRSARSKASSTAMTPSSAASSAASDATSSSASETSIESAAATQTRTRKTAGEPTAQTAGETNRQKPGEEEWQTVRRKRKNAPTGLKETLSKMRTPTKPRHDWIRQTAERTHRRDFDAEDSSSEDGEPRLDDQSKNAMVAAWTAFLREQKRERRSIRKGKQLQSAAAGANSPRNYNNNNNNRVSRKPSTTTTITTTTRVGERRRQLTNATTPKAPMVVYQSSLDTVKLMERKRPSEKFDGTTKNIDFDEHMARFLKAVNIPGLPAEWKLAEIPEWFGGIARIQVARYMRREDTEVAFTEAVNRLKEEYGQKTDSAEDMLADAMAKGVIDKNCADSMNMFVAQVISAFTLAQETGRDEDFHRKPLYKKILSRNLPHLKNVWAARIIKKGWKKPTFNHFALFLEKQRQIVACAADMDENEMRTKKTEPKNNTQIRGRNDQTTRSYAQAAERPSTSWGYTGNPGHEPNHRQRQNRREEEHLRGEDTYRERNYREGNNYREKRTRYPCPLCRMNHPLEYCERFIQLTPDERASYVIESERCQNCLKRGHKLEECYDRRRCTTCGADHHSMLHTAIAAKQQTKTMLPKTNQA